MSSLRRRLVLGTALTTFLAVGTAATAVAIADRVLTLRAVDRGLELELRGAHFRAIGGVLHGWRPADAAVEDTQQPEDDDDRRGDDDTLLVAWSRPQPERSYRSRALDPALAAALRDAPASEGGATLHLADGPSLRLLHSSVSELPRMPRRWRGREPDESLLPIALILAEDLSAVLADLRQRQLLLGATVLAATALAALGAALLARGLLRPLEALGRKIGSTQAAPDAEAISLDDAPAELRPIIDRLNELLDRVAAAVARERRVNADIAHELRTPLSGLRSQLEFALADGDEAAELRNAAGESLAIAIQMQELMENLLILGRLDAGQIVARREALRPAELVVAAWLPLAQRAEAKGIVLVNRIDPALEITSDHARLRMVLANLLGNAVAHSPPGTAVTVTREDDALVIANRCARSDPAIVAHALEPFWRGDAARSDTGLHCGLGLSIAERLCRALGGELTIALEDDRFVARITLPVDGAE